MLLKTSESFEETCEAFKTLKSEFYNIPQNYNEFVAKVHKYGICVIAKNETVEGLIAFYANNHETKVAFITSVLVSKNSRGKGIGTQLVKTCEDVCKEKGFKKISLEVHKENYIAISLYRKFGYKPYKENSVSIYMEKIIVQEENDNG